ncbi:MAG: hypothetical protein RLZZ306_1510 [Bacteroidota bacterium]|jgi:hypothetical protein
MKRNVLLGIILSGSSLTAFAQSSDIQKPITITPNVSIQNFDWRERSTVGSVGVELQFKPTKNLNLSVNGSVFNSLGNATNSVGNAVEISGLYDKTPAVPVYNNGGFGSKNSAIPKTNYQGAFINIDAGIPIKLGDSSRTTIEPFVGIEGKIWNRTADYGTEGNPMVHEEKYKFLSPSVGAKLNYSTKSKIRLSLRISASYPAISKLKTESKSLTNPNSEIDLTKWLSPSVELGVRVKKVTLKLRYERINIGTADTVRGCSPSMNVTGLSLGYDF